MDNQVAFEAMYEVPLLFSAHTLFGAIIARLKKEALMDLGECECNIGRVDLFWIVKGTTN
jgi:hypothetical protein